MRWCAGEGRGKASLKRPSENTLRSLVQFDRGEPFNLKRIRASVARLVTLSTQGGASVLYDVFGHDRTETTMGYMRAKGDLAEEIHQIEDRLRRARIKAGVIGARPDHLAGGEAQFVRDLFELDAGARGGGRLRPEEADATRAGMVDGRADETDAME